MKRKNKKKISPPTKVITRTGIAIESTWLVPWLLQNRYNREYNTNWGTETAHPVVPFFQRWLTLYLCSVVDNNPNLLICITDGYPLLVCMYSTRTAPPQQPVFYTSVTTFLWNLNLSDQPRRRIKRKEKKRPRPPIFHWWAWRDR